MVMKLYQLNLATLVVRLYLLMAIVIVAFFIGMPWLSILALPVFLSAMMGIRFSKNQRNPVAKTTAENTTRYAPHQAIHS